MLRITSIKVMERDHTERATKPRVYVWPTGETILDNLRSRRSRPTRQWRKAVEDKVNRAILMQTGKNLESAKWAWSQTAGCSCGCSPGFIIDAPARFDVHVDLEEI